eukprot:TRINITY_DN30767_c0_g2_i2.p1 TRINITY_DN30767_c0_g2~~TRINITY_DN30767_c0_g2_i2.p1  ORF type:complete len:502 (+),score=53.33 TRINITY_DN30767_c0_g2_i2:64-1569(+)
MCIRDRYMGEIKWKFHSSHSFQKHEMEFRKLPPRNSPILSKVPSLSRFKGGENSPRLEGLPTIRVSVASSKKSTASLLPNLDKLPQSFSTASPTSTRRTSFSSIPSEGNSPSSTTPFSHYYSNNLSPRSPNISTVSFSNTDDKAESPRVPSLDLTTCRSFTRQADLTDLLSPQYKKNPAIDSLRTGRRSSFSLLTKKAEKLRTSLLEEVQGTTANTPVPEPHLLLRHFPLSSIWKEDKLKRISKRVFQELKYALNLHDPPTKYSSSKSLTLEKLDPKSMTLFLELDRVLLNECSPFEADKIVYFTNSIGERNIPVRIRPFALEFLEKCSKHFNLVIFTRRPRDEAEALCQILDQERRLIKYVLHRFHCMETRGGASIKDLRIIDNLDLSKAILIDTSIQAFSLQLENGIPLLPWENEADDNELVNLFTLMMQIAIVENQNTQQFLRNRFQLKELAKRSSDFQPLSLVIPNNLSQIVTIKLGHFFFLRVRLVSLFCLPKFLP